MSIQDWSSLGEVGKGPRVRIPLSFGDRNSGGRYASVEHQSGASHVPAVRPAEEGDPLPDIVDGITDPAQRGFGHTGGQPLGIAAPEDGPEWLTSKNMFPVYGYLDTTKVSTVYGQFFKMDGVTTVGALGYSISPSSA